MRFVEFRAGPLDGRSAAFEGPTGRQDEEFPPTMTGFLYLPEPADPSRPPYSRVRMQTCTYVHGGEGVYAFAGSRGGMMNNFDYCAIKRLQEDESSWLRALVTDLRLGKKSEGSRSAPVRPLPLERAQELKEKALPRYRRWLQDKMGAGDLSDEETWEVFVYRTLGDLDWAVVGSVGHLGRCAV
jgi:hypothetical protein